jgi:hypothetical protein
VQAAEHVARSLALGGQLLDRGASRIEFRAELLDAWIRLLCRNAPRRGGSGGLGRLASLRAFGLDLVEHGVAFTQHGGQLLLVVLE